MAAYDKRILNAMLDSYENSLLSRGENKVAVHIAFQVTRKNMPEYFDESSLAYEEIHSVVAELESRGFITVIWRSKKENHILEKILLQQDHVDAVYSYMKRIPKWALESKVLRLLEELKAEYNTFVVSALIQYLSMRIKAGRSVKEYIDLGDETRIRQLLKAVFYIETNVAPCYIREFSIFHFSDSKAMDDLSGILGKIFRRFGKNFEGIGTYAILAEYAIYHTPNYVYLKGDCILYFGNKDKTGTDLRMLCHGIGISGTDLETMIIKGVPETQKVITVENLTTFFRWSEANSIIIYLGGYHNTVRRKLLNSIHQNLQTAQYLHFGDIDVGGFEIYEDLCRKTGIQFSPYHMDMETLCRYEKYARKLTANDRKRLDEQIEKCPEKCSYLDVLVYMKEKGIKLEQEILSFPMSHEVKI